MQTTLHAQFYTGFSSGYSSKLAMFYKSQCKKRKKNRPVLILITCAELLSLHLMKKMSQQQHFSKQQQWLLKTTLYLCHKRHSYCFIVCVLFSIVILIIDILRTTQYIMGLLRTLLWDYSVHYFGTTPYKTKSFWLHSTPWLHIKVYTSKSPDFNKKMRD